MGKYFGTDGFRGEANVTLTADHAYQVGRFLGWYCGECKRRGGDSEPAKVVIGKDTRRSSYMFEYALASGLVASGADAYLLHVTTTPSVSYVARTEGFDCGIMISASHNPFYDNGIKLIGRSGEKMDEDTIALIEDYLDGKLSVFGQTWETLPLAQRDHIGRTVDWSAGRNRYVGYLISLGMFSFKGKKVGLDCANGSAWMIARSVFDALGATTYVMGDEPDGFNINNGVGSTHIEALQRFVVEKGLDVGFAYDGDADRCLAVDEKGELVDGDKLIAIFAKAYKDQNKLKNNAAVVTVMTNLGFQHFAAAAGIDVVVASVGDRYVLEKMLDGGYNIGGEQSGHIIFLDEATTGDGQLSGAKLMEIMAQTGKKLSELATVMEHFPQVMINVKIAAKDREMWKNDPDITGLIAKREEELGDTGRILVRESGTEPLIRVMLEGRDFRRINTFAMEIADKIREKVGR